MRPSTALEIIDFSRNCVYSEDHRLLQRLNLQSLHNCSSLVWHFGFGHQELCLPRDYRQNLQHIHHVKKNP